MKRSPKKWKCRNDEVYNQQLWINEAEKVQNLINQKNRLTAKETK